MLTEPEGVPDYPFADNTDDTINTATTDTATTDSSPEADKPTAIAARTADDASRTTNESPRIAGHGATPAPSPTPTSGGATAQHSRSGLTVSGTLRFSPPPASSPTYNGSPRFIRGVIEVEGYVQGDGTLTLDEAVFRVRRG